MWNAALFRSSLCQDGWRHRNEEEGRERRKIREKGTMWISPNAGRKLKASYFWKGGLCGFKFLCLDIIFYFSSGVFRLCPWWDSTQRERGRSGIESITVLIRKERREEKNSGTKNRKFNYISRKKKEEKEKAALPDLKVMSESAFFPLCLFWLGIRGVERHFFLSLPPQSVCGCGCGGRGREISDPDSGRKGGEEERTERRRRSGKRRKSAPSHFYHVLPSSSFLFFPSSPLVPYPILQRYRFQQTKFTFVCETSLFLHIPTTLEADFAGDFS